MSNIKEILDKNNGVITYSEVKEAKVSYNVIRKMLLKGELEKDDDGIYRRPNAYVDELFSLQHRYPSGIFSLETSLLLHGISLTIPYRPVMTFPYGTNTKLIKENGIKAVIVRSHYNEGIIDVITPVGQYVKTYEVERSLCECLRKIYMTDTQIVGPAFRAYFAKGKINYHKISLYSKLFGVQEKVQSYLEVLS